MFSFADVMVRCTPLILVFAWLVFRSTRNVGRSVVHALFVSGVICLSLAITLIISIIFVRRIAPPSSQDSVVRHEFENTKRYSVFQDVKAVSSRAAAFEEGITGRVATGADRTIGKPHVATTVDGEILVLPLSNEVLVEILGKEGALAIESLNVRLSTELRQGYAMIPIAAPGAVPSMLNGVVVPSVMEHALSPTGLGILRRVVAEFMLSIRSQQASSGAAIGESGSLVYGTVGDTDTSDTDVMTAEAEDGSVHELADWIANPGTGRVVIRSRMVDASVPVSEVLKVEVVEALMAHIAEIASHEFVVPDGWEKLVELQVTDEALNECIVDTDALLEIVTTVEGDHPMRQTYALVEFPAEIETQAVAKVRGVLKQNRLIVFCVALASLWLCSLFLSIAVRTGTCTSMVKKLATLPVLALLMIPCLLVFVTMVKGMIDGEAMDFGESQHRTVCIIDAASE